MDTPARPPRRRLPAALCLLLATTLAACGQQDQTGGDPGAGTEQTTATPPEQQDPAVVAVHEDVSYYYACGNEVLHHEVDGAELVYYPLLREEEHDPTRYGTGMGVRFGAVVPPGPGDDTGTLTVYDDGFARFVSDSGRETWLHEDSRDYNWIC